jgi:hypothetical protein
MGIIFLSLFLAFFAYMIGRAYVLFARHIALDAWAWIRIGIGVHRGTAFGLASNGDENSI